MGSTVYTHFCNKFSESLSNNTCGIKSFVIALFCALHIYIIILHWSSLFTCSTHMVQPDIQIGLYSNLLNYVLVKTEEYKRIL